MLQSIQILLGKGVETYEKEKNSFLKKLSNIICQFLILLAPFALANTASIVLWGEPECPDELKKASVFQIIF